MNCIFCKIVNGEIPSYTIYEDDIVKVFLDVKPDCNGHMLVIPKKHIMDLDTMDDETFSHMLNVSKDMKKLLESKLHIDGLTLIQNNGDIQEVKHFHIHLKPYYRVKQELIDITNIYNILTK